ncbi:CD225/dispanin family protein [Embleya sp. NPDC050493]|uniref:CD225/dispanin family protein n=1 Tax=Embleya sp. NPDC050493 TaxID=3363989 RepID=UPI0037AADC77
MAYGYPGAPGGGEERSDRTREWNAPARPFGHAMPYGPPTTPPPAGPPPGPPENYLAWAIVATVFCCFLAGVPALLAATSVNERWHRGDVAGARLASLRARNWTIGTVLLGVIFWTTWMVGVFLLGWKDTLGDL